MARRKKSGDEEGGAYWMDTYGDLVTLLLCFFVLLFSFSSIDSKKWEALVGALSGSNSIAIPVLNPDTASEKPINDIWRPVEYDESDAVDMENYRQLVANIQGEIEANGLEVTVHEDPEKLRLILRFRDNVLFDSGKADLRPAARDVLNKISESLATNLDLIDMIRIEGHTDNVPISYPYKNNMELSIYRAMSAWDYVVATKKIPDERLATMGFGERKPVASNATNEGRQANRRVDFVIESLRTIGSQS